MSEGSRSDGGISEGDVLLRVCIESEEEEDAYRWYTIDPNNPDYPEARADKVSVDVRLTPDCTLCLDSSHYASVVLGSKIYLIGGVESTLCSTPSVVGRPIYGVPSCKVMVYDNGWKTGTPMIGGKARPVTAVVDGKIYVFSSTFSGYIVPDEPCAEVYDPCSDSWLALPYPPSALWSDASFPGYEIDYCINPHNTNAATKILFYCSTKRNPAIWSFDVTKSSWKEERIMRHLAKLNPFTDRDCHLEDDDDDTFPTYFGVSRVFVQGFLYIWKGFTLYCFDLAKRLEIHVDSSQLRNRTNFLQPSCTILFLFHTGPNNQLSLLWPAWRALPDRQRICCLTFSIKFSHSGTGQHSAHAHDPKFYTYLAKGTLLQNCLPVRRATCQDILSCQTIGTVAKHVFPDPDKKQVGAPFPISQETRHARRVYVGDLPEGVDSQGRPLRIRRPSDYNPGLAGHLGCTQPSWSLNLEAVDRQPIREVADEVNILRRTMQALAWEASLSHSNEMTVLSRVVCLLEAVDADNMRDDMFHVRALKEFRLKGEKYGKVKTVVIPRPIGRGNNPAAGRVFLEYGSPQSSANAINGITKEIKGILAFCYPEAKYRGGDYSFLDDYCNLKFRSLPKHIQIQGRGLQLPG